MRNHTNIEQGKKIGEILPVSSADLTLIHMEKQETMDTICNGIDQCIFVPFSEYDNEVRKKYNYSSYFPCWSTTELMNLMAKRGIFVTLRVSPIDLTWSVSCDISDVWKIFKSDSPINAIVEMIIWLNENKYLSL